MVEVREFKKGDSHNELKAIYEQLPFFCCSNKILNESCQRDISKYVYCSETSTPPYQGVYGDTPNVWIDKYYIIKNAVEMKKEVLRLQAKASRELKNGNK